MTLTQYSDNQWKGACRLELQTQIFQAIQNQAVVLKNGLTSKVWFHSETQFVVKHFKARSQSSILPQLRKPRAQRAAENAALFIDKGFQTPRVLAYFKDKNEKDSSFLVTEQALGQALEERLLSKTLDPTIVIHWLARLHKAKLFHRDLKRSNLFIHNQEIIAIDLDSLVFNPLRTLEAISKDLGMLLSSAGGVFSNSELEKLARLYQDQRQVSERDFQSILQGAITVAKKRFDRGSTPGIGGWPRA